MNKFVIVSLVVAMNFCQLSQSFPTDQEGNEGDGVDIVGRKECTPVPNSCEYGKCGGKRKCRQGLSIVDEISCKLGNGSDSRLYRCCKCSSTPITDPTEPNPPNLGGNGENVQIICNGNTNQCTSNPIITAIGGNPILNLNPPNTTRP